ncbi:MAG: cadherin domain-containing protein, partial [Panacagrimonas sp.]
MAPGSEFDNAMMLQDAEGQQYSIFLSADTEVVVAEAEDLQVAEAETPDAEYEDLSRPGGAPETAPVEDVGAPPNVVGDPPPPVGPQNYGANPNSPVVYEQDQGAGNFVLPMLGGIIGAGALIALANENEDESDERREESPAPNAPPIIASNGGGDSAQISIAENNQAVTTVSALDPDLNAVSYGLAGGADAALFSINSITGALSLLNPPDFENPLDAGGDNVYEVSVLATDGVLADFQSLSVQVVNSGSEPNQAPVITSGDDDLFALNIAEQAELNVAITAQDPDGDDITLSVIGGADANRFVFDADTGLLTLPAQDFENPLDANGDNRYVIVIQAADEQDADAQIVIVTVTDIDDG